jgi:hypothetical protein
MSTHLLPTAAAGPLALAFECTSKRHSSGGRDASVGGVDSSIKKRPDTRWSPRNRVTIAADETVDMDMVLDLIRDIQIDKQHPTFRQIPSRTIPRVSISQRFNRRQSCRTPT